MILRTCRYHETFFSASRRRKLSRQIFETRNISLVTFEIYVIIDKSLGKKYVLSFFMCFLDRDCKIAGIYFVNWNKSIMQTRNEIKIKISDRNDGKIFSLKIYCMQL